MRQVRRGSGRARSDRLAPFDLGLTCQRTLSLKLGAMPHKSGALLDSAAADAFIAGYKRVLLRVAGTIRENGSDPLETLVHARRSMMENAAI